ncbi:MAG: hypothetical protein U0Q16_36290 [Bryobacteraceae bacterium]
MPDVAIPLVFPDYLIAVVDHDVKVNLPSLPSIPGMPPLPKSVTIPHKVPYLGHAGVLFINGKTGVTKYYEYGRYDPGQVGIVRKQTVPDVKISGGKPTKASLTATLQRVSSLSGQRGRIEGVYLELPDGAFDKMLKYADGRLAKNSDPKRDPYQLFTNSCVHFAVETARAGGADLPVVIPPNPSGYIKVAQEFNPDLSYSPPSTTTAEVALP